MGSVLAKLTGHQCEADQNTAKSWRGKFKTNRVNRRSVEGDGHVPIQYQRLTLVTPERPFRIKFRSREEIESQRNYSNQHGMRRRTHPLATYSRSYSPLGGVTYCADERYTDQMSDESPEEECILLSKMNQRWEARRASGERRYSYHELEYSSRFPNRKDEVRYGTRSPRNSIQVNVEPPTPDATDEERNTAGSRPRSMKKRKKTRRPNSLSPGRHRFNH